MRVVELHEIDLFDIGNTIQLAGAIWSGNGRIFLAPFPGQSIEQPDPLLFDLDLDDWHKVLYQSDVLDIQGLNKAILRKSQRTIDQHVAWKVFKRDNYKCRYCGKEGPLTVDHVILWENGGATVEDNLISACSRCNKTRGRMEYKDWINSAEYSSKMRGLEITIRVRNLNLIGDLDRLRAIPSKPRSR